MSKTMTTTDAEMDGTTPTTATLTYPKRLEGVRIIHNNKSGSGTVEGENDMHVLLQRAFEFVDGDQKENQSDASNTTTTIIMSSSSCPSDTSCTMLIPTLTKDEARTILLEYRDYTQQKDQNKKQKGRAFTASSSAVIPIRVLRSIATILGEDVVEHALQQRSQEQRTVCLSYTPPPAADGEDSTDGKTPAERAKFKQRMQRLRLKNEERKYGKLTANLGRVVQDDDITTKSMTYAASIGLNMIVAPLSFGCLMYYFGGSVLDYVWPIIGDGNNNHATKFSADIRKMIVAVVSGVLMLFVEMLLFVIRTNELDRAMRKKQRKNSNQPGKPFGYYTSKTSKTFKDE